MLTKSEIWQQQYDNFSVMYGILWSDVIETGDKAKSSTCETDIERRTCTRACFAFIEGVSIGAEALSSFGRLLRGDKDIPKGNLSTMLNTTLRRRPEYRYDANYKDRREFSKRIKDSFKAVSGAVGQSFDLSTQNKEWADFLNSVKVRDRLMHPHCAEDLIVNNLDLALVLRSTAWFHNMFSDAVLGKEKKLV